MHRHWLIITTLVVAAAIGFTASDMRAWRLAALHSPVRVDEAAFTALLFIFFGALLLIGLMVFIAMLLRKPR